MGDVDREAYYRTAERQIEALHAKLEAFAAVLESLGYDCYNAERNGYLDKPAKKGA